MMMTANEIMAHFQNVESLEDGEALVYISDLDDVHVSRTHVGGDICLRVGPDHINDYSRADISEIEMWLQDELDYLDSL